MNRTLLAVLAPAFALTTLVVGLRLGTTARAETAHGALLATAFDADRAVVLVASGDLEDGLLQPRSQRSLVLQPLEHAPIEATTDDDGFAAFSVPISKGAATFAFTLRAAKTHALLIDTALPVPRPHSAYTHAKYTLRPQQSPGGTQEAPSLLEGALVIGQQMLVAFPKAPAGFLQLRDASQGLTLDARALCTDGRGILAVTATFTTALLALSTGDGKTTVFSADVPVLGGVPAFGAERTFSAGESNSSAMVDGSDAVGTSLGVDGSDAVGTSLGVDGSDAVGTSLGVDGLPNDTHFWIAETDAGGVRDLRRLTTVKDPPGRAFFRPFAEGASGRKSGVFYALRSVDGLLPAAPQVAKFPAAGRVLAQASEPRATPEKPDLCALASAIPEDLRAEGAPLATTAFSGIPALEAKRHQTRNRGLTLGTLALFLAALVEVFVFLAGARESAEKLRKLQMSSQDEAGSSEIARATPLQGLFAVLPGLLVVLLGCLFVIALLWN